MTVHVGIGFVTGRKNFKYVLRTYINNWLEHGLITNQKISLHLFVAYDLKYQNTVIKDYKNIDPLLIELIDSITFIGEGLIKKEIDALTSSGKVDAKEAGLIFGEGYAKKRNSVLYFAMKHKVDKLIFLDDDEYPLAVFRDEYKIVTWTGQRIIGTHLKFNDDADITHGHHCGYISPIPALEFNQDLTENDFKLFTETISNDIISWENVKTNIIANNGITYGDQDIVRKATVKEVGEINGMKFISGANICFNFQRGNKFPPFFNPPGARGEDTFMSTCLTDLKVLKVPCYAFHDGFSTYNHLLNGVLPVQFFPIDAKTTSVKNRFINATIGWIRYKPLLMYITQRENYDTIIADMKSKLEITIPKLCKYFDTQKFEQLHLELAHYDKNVKKHFDTFQNTKKAWDKITGQPGKNTE